MADPRPKYAKVNPQNPEAWGQCDRCGFWRNTSDLVWQFEWGGLQLYSQELLVCADRCYDTPQEQLRTIILPPDPPPIVNARVPDFDYEEQTPIIYQFVTPNLNKKQVNAGVASPPWGAGPAQQMCNQQGTVVMVLQYLTSS